MNAQLAAMMPAGNIGGDKKSRELYVGNVPMGLTGEQLQQLLGGAMELAELAAMPGNPVVALQLSGKEGRGSRPTRTAPGVASPTPPLPICCCSLGRRKAAPCWCAWHA
jgi:hypothetical protein|eukprot:COSAG01_NODE_4979_length_4565_cov_5.005364_5_plen_109_part_00